MMRPKSDSYRDVPNTGQKMSCSTANEQTGSDSGSKKYVLSCSPINAVILHPSFLCPALKKTGDDLNLFVLGDKNFNKTFQEAEGCEGNKAGPSVPGAVNFYLKIVTWPSKDNTRHAPAPLFPSTGEAVSNIEVYYLWQVSDLDNGVLTDKDGKPFAQIHPDVLKQYQDRSLNWGFQIVIKNLPNDAPGLYDISWMNYERPKTEDESGYFYELQDQYFNDFNTTYRNELPLSCNVSNDKSPKFTEEPTELQSYHPLYISAKPCIGIGHLSDVHISSRQHLFTQSKARLIDGKEGHKSDDIGTMVNTSYATLKDLMAQMGDDDDIDLLIFTGDLIDYNRNFNPNNSIDNQEDLKKSSGIWQALNLDNLGNEGDEKRYPIGIDNLVMYELFHWYYTDKGKPILLIAGNHEAYTLPYGISPRVKLLRGAWASYAPTWGNVSVDKMIQNSIDQAKDDKEEVDKSIKNKKGPDIYFDRANEGIPADHNLTITEAILMYGPDYARIVMGGSSTTGGETNFRPVNLKWFFHIFTPLTSFYITYGDKQCFIGLGWGNKENFFGHIPESGLSKPGGFLPRSVEGVSDSQLEIMNEALKRGITQNILCSHFTYANYNSIQPFSKKGKVHFSNTYTQNDYGTFQINRDKVYRKVKDQIQYTLSGHSHRSGLYQFGNKIKPTNRRGVSNSWEVTGQATVDKIFKPNGGVRLLVAASGGPIPVQNHDNELYNFGMDVPSGNYIKVSGTTENGIGIKQATPKQSKPRLAVALDYADIFLRQRNLDNNALIGVGALEKFLSRIYNGSFTIQFADEVKLKANEIIDELLLVIYKKNGMKSLLQVKAVKTNPSQYIVTPNNYDKTLKDAVRYKYKLFMDITFKSGGRGTELYNTDSHWVFPIEVIDRQSESLKMLNKIITQASSAGAILPPGYYEKEKQNILDNVDGYRVQRQSLYGEIPDFIFYSEINADEYEI